jgi:hypothetical protein
MWLAVVAFVTTLNRRQLREDQVLAPIIVSLYDQSRFLVGLVCPWVFDLSTNRELKIRSPLGTSDRFTSSKTPFSKRPSISFYRDSSNLGLGVMSGVRSGVFTYP